MTSADATAIARAAHTTCPGQLFTIDGDAAASAERERSVPRPATNVVPLSAQHGRVQLPAAERLPLVLGVQRVHGLGLPAVRAPFTGGIPGTSRPDSSTRSSRSFRDRARQASSNDKTSNTATIPNNPRDPDRGPEASPDDPIGRCTNDDDQKETRLRFIPSGLANEILLDVYVRRASFEPAVTDLSQRLFDAYASEVARIDGNDGGVVDGVVTFVEADLEGTSDGGQSNDRLYLPATQFNRFEVTREINDGLLAPRFAPSDRALVLSGTLVPVSPAIRASIRRDGDDR